MTKRKTDKYNIKIPECFIDMQEFGIEDFLKDLTKMLCERNNKVMGEEDVSATTPVVTHVAILCKSGLWKVAKYNGIDPVGMSWQKFCDARTAKQYCDIKNKIPQAEYEEFYENN